MFTEIIVFYSKYQFRPAVANVSFFGEIYKVFLAWDYIFKFSVYFLSIGNIFREREGYLSCLKLYFQIYCISWALVTYFEKRKDICLVGWNIRLTVCGEAADETGAETQEARGGGSRVCPNFQDSLFFRIFHLLFLDFTRYWTFPKFYPRLKLK